MSGQFGNNPAMYVYIIFSYQYHHAVLTARDLVLEFEKNTITIFVKRISTPIISIREFLRECKSDNQRMS
jgi:hypothetical protein